MKTFSPWLTALSVLAAGTIGLAQIERLSLEQMVQRTDDAVVGTIAQTKVFRVDHPVDGPELYFTTLSILGKSLQDGRPLEVQVTFPGGFINENEGVWNSEAPTADEIRIGNKIVAFYGWVDNMGGWSQTTSSGWKGDVFVYEGDSHMGSQTFKSRDTFTKSGAASMKHVWEAQVAGKWMTVGEETCKKT